MHQSAAFSPPILLTIAGFDPCAGAGVGADLKTFAAHNCYGMGALTALTIQNTAGVRRVEPVAAKLLREQLEELLQDVSIAAVKVGMLASQANIRVVGEWLEKAQIPHVVLDPILHSTSGAELLEPAGVQELSKRLFPLATVITPNLAEAAALSGVEVHRAEEMKLAAVKLREAGARAIVITGGEWEKSIDLLYQGGEFAFFSRERVKSQSTHGTGCAFSSALAANLATGRQLPDAVVLAKAYVAKAIEKGYAIGKGKGPLNHFYRQQDGAVVHSHSTHVPEEGPAHSLSHF